jgi:hypothetical protein
MTAGASERSAPSAGISWTGCGTQLECARVSVPLDWTHQGGRTITLSVIRHRGPFDPGFGQPAASR